MKYNLWLLILSTLFFSACKQDTLTQRDSVKERTCLQPHDELKVKRFLNKIKKYIDTNNSKAISSHIVLNEMNETEDMKEIYRDIIKEKLSTQWYSKYPMKKQEKYTTYRTFFQKNSAKRGCYQYVLDYTYYPRSLSDSSISPKAQKR